MHGRVAETPDDKLRSACAADPIFAARLLFPDWFKRPMPWLHRGIIAILLRRTDFLLNFSEPGKPEQWPQANRHWTKKDLAKLVKHFVYKINPKDPKSPTAPIFRVRYAEDGRTPIAIDMVLGRHFACMIPRGFSKTTLINFVNLYKTIHKLTKFTVYVSEAAPHAEDQLATIKREISANERLIALYGILKPDRSDDETWGAKSFETRTGVKFAARGHGAQIRGMNRFGHRPDTIVLDDVEDEESVATEAQRDKTLKWFVGAVEPALDRDNENACVYILGTMLDPKALLPTLIKDPEYTGVVFGAAIPTGEVRDTGQVDPTGQPILEPIMEALWDDKAGLSLEAIDKKKGEFASKGALYNFYLEYMSTDRDEAKLKFKSEYIRYKTYKPADFIARSIHIDPAISKTSGSDYCAIAVVGITESGHKHVCDFHAEVGMPMSDQAEKYFELKMKWDCTHHSSESTAYQAALAQVIRTLMFQKAKVFGTKAYFEIIDTWPSGRKIERVEGILQPIMASGYLTFQQIWPELEVMFSDWPKGKLDGPDCIAGAISTIEPQYAALSYGDGEALSRPLDDDPDFDAPCAMGYDEVP